MQQTDLLQLMILIVLIMLSGYFSSSETALSSVSRITLKSLADEGDERARKTMALLDNYSKMLSAILIGNNVVNLSASALATSLIIRVLGQNMVSLGTAVLTILIILFGEITPKNSAKTNALEISLRNTPVIQFLTTALTPVIAIVDVLSGVLLRLSGTDPNAKQKLTESELKTYVEVGQEDGAIEGREKKIIYNVFDFGDAVAKDIMVPRIDMSCVPDDASYEQVMSLFRLEMFTRIPVYEKDFPDRIIGHLNIKDFVGLTDPSKFNLRRMLHSSYFTYEYKKTADLLKEMQQQSFGVAFVLDEYGNTVGMITLEDLVEEIVGEIRDEYDEDEKSLLRQYDEKTYLADGSMKLIDLNDSLGTDFRSEDYDSIGGLIIERLERIPQDGETVTLEDGTILQAKGIRRNRIMKVLIRFREIPRREQEETLDPSDT
jgi:putative hemolysin